MIKYTPTNQLTLVGFSQSFEKDLDSQNRWVLLVDIIPLYLPSSVHT